MVNNSININKIKNLLSPQLIEFQKDHVIWRWKRKSRSWFGTGNKHMAGSNWLMGSQFTLPLLIHVCTSNWISMGYTYKQTTKTSTDFLPLKNTTYFFAIYDLSKYSIITFYYLITFFSIDIVLLFFSTI